MRNVQFGLALMTILPLGCATYRPSFTEFLSDYSQLHPDSKVSGAHVFWDADVDRAQYDDEHDYPEASWASHLSKYLLASGNTSEDEMRGIGRPRQGKSGMTRVVSCAESESRSGYGGNGLARFQGGVESGRSKSGDTEFDSLRPT